MTKILIIAAVIDLDKPDEPQEQHSVPAPKPTPQDALLRKLFNEVRKEYHPDFWKDINGTFFKG